MSSMNQAETARRSGVLTHIPGIATRPHEQRVTTRTGPDGGIMGLRSFRSAFIRLLPARSLARAAVALAAET